MIYWDLFLGFLKVGCFTFGGAYSAIPLIRDVVRSYGWLSDEILTYMIAVSESTPGPIIVNLATYVGNSQAGFWGAVLATLAVVMPSFFVILLIMGVLITAAFRPHSLQSEDGFLAFIYLSIPQEYAFSINARSLTTAS